MKKAVTKKKPKAMELSQGKPRQEETSFYEKFSGRQLNAVLLLILASTFLVQGVMNYLNVVDLTEFLKPWLTMIFLSLILLVVSVVSIVIAGVMYSLKLKRTISMISFITFIMGFIFFLTIYLICIGIILIFNYGAHKNERN